MRDTEYRLNTLHAAYPMSGDYWEEHLVIYFVVLQPVVGGAIVCDEKIHRRHDWSFDLGKSRFMSDDELLRRVRYKGYDGWVADVHPARLGSVVAEWHAMGSPVMDSMGAA